MVRTIVAVLATIVLTTVAVPVWFIALVLIESFFNSVNEASVAGYGRYCFMLAIPVALVTGFGIAPMANLFAANVSRRKSRALLSLGVLFWLGYVAFHVVGVYGFYRDVFPLEWLEYFTLALFLAPPVYVGCCVYMAISGRWAKGVPLPVQDTILG